MRIQFISQIPFHYKKKLKAHLHFVPYHLEKLGHKIDIIERKDWTWFYLKYLKFKPDVMIVSALVGFFPILFKKLGLIRKPIIYYWGDYFYEGMGRKWDPAKCAFMELFCVKNASIVTTPSKFLKTVCNNLAINCEYIPHGIEPEALEVKPSNLPELSVKQKKLSKFIHLGNINKYKQVSKIIQAVKGKRCILYLIGKEEEPGLIKDLPKNIIYLGELPKSKAISYVKSCDIAVITSDQDSTLKMFEYLKLGKPILAFNGRINYVLTHNENAYLTDDFSKAINKLIKDKEILGILSKNAKKFKINSWKKEVEKYDKIIKNL